ncbi:MAG TPA: sigma-70 family RNA polymerase sigma factor, partial [Gemmataceae bacterium]|nr:sigma-70 family RNA polymerase sigma factor [Gemmataceae bacterium]
MSGRTNAAIRLVRAAARSAGLGQRTDPELLTAFLAGERDAFEALVRRHGPLVLQACRQAARCEADAEDIFQATFVQLYQRAASIRNRPSLAGWLFRVARRSATNARRAALRRERREARTESRSDSTTDLSWREACAVLHEELDRLPDAYRLPLLLCYLQGLSRDEAARQLGSTLDAVRGRLDRGRARLRARLLKRGISLSAGLFTAAVTSAVPAGLIPRTLAAARTASPILVRGLAWKAASVLTVAATVLVGGVIHDRGAQAQPAKPAADRPAEKKEPEATKSVTVSGRVLDPDGKPVAGAKVYVRQSEMKEVDRPSARTDPDGRFTVAVPAADAEARSSVIAVADGFAAGWQTWDGEPPEDLTLTLARDDVPIRGRILDLQGKPLARVTLTVKAVHAFPKEGPNAYLEWLSGLRSRPIHNTLFGAPPGPAQTVTAADGTFRLDGIGRDRAVQLSVTGQGIAYESIYPLTVPALGVKPTARTGKIYPATFDHLTAPARPIRGTVRDAATGKPLPGLRVNGYGGAVDVTTDADGRYELPGYKKGPKYTVYVRPADGSEYFPAQAEAADQAGFDPLVIDLKVQPGIPVSGSVREKSGTPVAGTVRYYAFAGNPNVGQIPVGDFYTQEVAIRPDGGFTVAVLPGLGFLGIKTKGHYPAARVDPDRFFFLEGLDSR